MVWQSVGVGYAGNVVDHFVLKGVNRDMMEKIKVELGEVQKNLLLPLWGRAVESQKEDPRLVYGMAVEIINKIDYDFTTITKNISWLSQFSWVARSLHVDKTILEFIKNNPNATIVNIGCDLDTTFERIDNGQIIFYDLDLPDVINLRKNFFQENERKERIRKGSIIILMAKVIA